MAHLFTLLKVKCNAISVCENSLSPRSHPSNVLPRTLPRHSSHQPQQREPRTEHNLRTPHNSLAGLALAAYVLNEGSSGRSRTLELHPRHSHALRLLKASTRRLRSLRVAVLRKVMVVSLRAWRHKAICCKDHRVTGKQTTLRFHDSSDHQFFSMERAERDLLRCSQSRKPSKERISSQGRDLVERLEELIGNSKRETLFSSSSSPKYSKKRCYEG